MGRDSSSDASQVGGPLVVMVMDAAAEGRDGRHGSNEGSAATRAEDGGGHSARDKVLLEETPLPGLEDLLLLLPVGWRLGQ